MYKKGVSQELSFGGEGGGQGEKWGGWRVRRADVSSPERHLIFRKSAGAFFFFVFFFFFFFASTGRILKNQPSS